MVPFDTLSVLCLKFYAFMLLQPSSQNVQLSPVTGREACVCVCLCVYVLYGALVGGREQLCFRAAPSGLKSVLLISQQVNVITLI